MKQRLRQLQPGERIPEGTPRYYKDAVGYVRARWTVAPHEQVEIREHRIVEGVVISADIHVHHINGIKCDNRPENLQLLDQSTHCQHHHPVTFDVAEAYRLYEAGASLPTLADKYGRHFVTIMRAFKRRGLPVRSLTESWVYRARPCFDKSGASQLLLEGWPVNAVAKVFGVSRYTVNELRKTLGVAALPCGRPSGAHRVTVRP